MTRWWEEISKNKTKVNSNSQQVNSSKLPTSSKEKIVELFKKNKVIILITFVSILIIVVALLIILSGEDDNSPTPPPLDDDIPKNYNQENQRESEHCVDNLECISGDNCCPPGCGFVLDSDCTFCILDIDCASGEYCSMGECVLVEEETENETPSEEDLNIKNLNDYSNKIYIDPNYEGLNGASDGSLDKPWTSWNGVTFTQDTAYLQKRGTTADWDGSKKKEVNVNNVLIGAYGDSSLSNPIIMQTTPSCKHMFSTIADHTTFRDLILKSSGSQSGIITQTASNYATIYNIIIESVSQSETFEWGIRLFGTEGHRVLYTKIIKTGEDGIWAGNLNNVEIGYSQIIQSNQNYLDTDTQKDILCNYDPADCIDPKNATCHSGGDSIQFENVKNWHVHHNILSRPDTGNKFNFIANNGGSTSGLFEYNILDGPIGTGGASIFFGEGQSGYVIRYNKINPPTPRAIFQSTSNLQVYGNIFAGGLDYIMNWKGGDSYYYNNVFYNFQGENILGGTNTTYVYNNIFDNRNGQKIYIGLREGTMEEGNNLYLNNSNINSIFIDAEKGDFHLKVGSPAIDAGEEQSVFDSEFTKDMKGTTIPQGDSIDIGAYEYKE